MLRTSNLVGRLILACLSIFCAAFYQISTDNMLVRSLSNSWASCRYYISDKYRVLLRMSDTSTWNTYVTYLFQFCITYNNFQCSCLISGNRKNIWIVKISFSFSSRSAGDTSRNLTKNLVTGNGWLNTDKKRVYLQNFTPVPFDSSVTFSVRNILTTITYKSLSVAQPTCLRQCLSLAHIPSAICSLIVDV